MIKFHGEPCTLDEIKLQIRIRWQLQHSRGIITAMGIDFVFYLN